MKPDVARFLEVAVSHLMTNVAPALASSYERSSMVVFGLMLTAVRHEFERAAARRVEENRELRRIFAGAMSVVEAAELGSRLERAANGEETSLAISDLEQCNAALRGLLIELHAHVEELDSPQARRLEAEIWQELVVSTERRALPMLGSA